VLVSETGRLVRVFKGHKTPKAPSGGSNVKQSENYEQQRAERNKDVLVELERKVCNPSWIF
jgi:hypothetical protein